VIEVPSQLRRVYADVDRAAIEAWWGGLDDEARADVARLCDERADACFCRFVADDDAWGFDEWGPSYFEHLIEHPELVLVWDPPERTFHTGCTRHPLAQGCWSSGAVPRDFACPFANGSTCLMRPLAGRRIRRRRIR